MKNKVTLSCSINFESIFDKRSHYYIRLLKRLLAIVTELF